MPGLWQPLERLEARVSLRRSVLKVAEHSRCGSLDPNGMLTRILDEPILAHPGAAEWLPACRESGGGYGELATACAKLRLRMLWNRSTVSPATFNTHAPAWRITLPGR